MKHFSVPAGLAISALVYWKTRHDEVPSFYVGVQVSGTVISLIWTYLLSGILIDQLQFLGMLSQLDKTYLGLSVIAVGNALPDGITTIALAKQGHAVMGLTGAYAGQLFGLLVGFGLALLKKTLSDGSQGFDLFAQWGENVMDILVLVTALVNLLVTFVYGVARHYSFS